MMIALQHAMSRTLILLAAMLALAVGSLPASASDGASTSTTTPAQRVHVVVIDKMEFGPMPTDVRAGDIIEWDNRDIFEHSATARDGSFDIDLKPASKVRSVATAGTAAFFCKYHPTMTATLVVR
jgi:plastocyanin